MIQIAIPLLGLATTLGLAALAAYSPLRMTDHYIIERDGLAFDVSEASAWWRRRVWILPVSLRPWRTTEGESFSPADLAESLQMRLESRPPDFPHLADPLAAAGRYQLAGEEIAGWPFPAFRHWGEFGEPERDRLHGALAFAPGPSGRHTAVSIIPMWTGLLIDTALFSALWAAALLGIPRCRGHLRRRRGHCPACNYDLRADFTAGCPECAWRR